LDAAAHERCEKQQQEQATGTEATSKTTVAALSLAVEGYAWLASGYDGFHIDWPWTMKSNFASTFANKQTHQLRVPQPQNSQNSFATYNLYTYTSTDVQHRSSIHDLNHPTSQNSDRRTRCGVTIPPNYTINSSPPTPMLPSALPARPQIRH
jgi:hypothetical protein